MTTITFSTTRPLSLRELALSQQMGKGDYAAAIELMVQRSDPKVGAEAIGNLAGQEIQDTFTALGDSFRALTNFQQMIERMGDVFGSEGQSP